jgi:hypothetical protein
VNRCDITLGPVPADPGSSVRLHYQVVWVAKPKPDSEILENGSTRIKPFRLRLISPRHIGDVNESKTMAEYNECRYVEMFVTGVKLMSVPGVTYCSRRA